MRSTPKMGKSKKRCGHSNTITAEYFRQHDKANAKSIFNTIQEDFESNGYYVQVLKCFYDVPSDDNIEGSETFIVKSTNDKDKIIEEIECIEHLRKSVSNPCKYIRESIRYNVGNKVALRMPYFLKFSDLRKLDHYPSRCAKYARQLIDQMAQMHIYDVFHGDIKNDNILYDVNTDEVCLMDLGESQRIEETVKAKYKHLDKWDIHRSLYDNGAHFQTSAYRPPECFHDEDREEYEEWQNAMYNAREKVASGSAKHRRILKRLEREQPSCTRMIDTFTEDELNAAEWTFCYHNTIYSDTYAMGAMIMEYMGANLSSDQNDFLLMMRSCNVKDRPVSTKLTWDHLAVFDIKEDDIPKSPPILHSMLPSSSSRPPHTPNICDKTSLPQLVRTTSDEIDDENIEEDEDMQH